MKKIKQPRPSRHKQKRFELSDNDRARLSLMERRRQIRAIEHRLEIMLRSEFLPPTFGLGWAEGSRGDCWQCGVPRVRRWAGRWIEYHSRPFEVPYDICRTQPLCAACTLAQGHRAHFIPRWRPRNWRQIPYYTQPAKQSPPPAPSEPLTAPLALDQGPPQIRRVDQHPPA